MGGVQADGCILRYGGSLAIGLFIEIRVTGYRTCLAADQREGIVWGI